MTAKRLAAAVLTGRIRLSEACAPGLEARMKVSTIGEPVVEYRL